MSQTWPGRSVPGASRLRLLRCRRLLVRVVTFLQLAKFVPARVLRGFGGVWILFVLEPKNEPVDEALLGRPALPRFDNQMRSIGQFDEVNGLPLKFQAGKPLPAFEHGEGLERQQPDRCINPVQVEAGRLFQPLLQALLTKGRFPAVQGVVILVSEGECEVLEISAINAVHKACGGKVIARMRQRISNEAYGSAKPDDSDPIPVNHAFLIEGVDCRFVDGCSRDSVQLDWAERRTSCPCHSRCCRGPAGSQSHTPGGQ